MRSLLGNRYKTIFTQEDVRKSKGLASESPVVSPPEPALAVEVPAAVVEQVQEAAAVVAMVEEAPAVVEPAVESAVSEIVVVPTESSTAAVEDLPVEPVPVMESVTAVDPVPVGDTVQVQGSAPDESVVNAEAVDSASPSDEQVSEETPAAGKSKRRRRSPKSKD